MCSKAPTLFLWLLLWGTGCATAAKLDPHKPIAIEPGLIRSDYQQDGESLDLGNLVDSLEANPVTETHVNLVKSYYIPAVALTTGGGALVGYGAIQLLKNQESGALAFGTGAVIASAGIFCAVKATGHLYEAVSLHNGTMGVFRPDKGFPIKIVPVFDVNYASKKVMGGIQMIF